MLRVIITLDCNTCGQPFEGIETTKELDPLGWKARLQDLEDTAEASGWFFFRGGHYCDYCVSDAAVARRVINLARGNRYRHGRV